MGGEGVTDRLGAVVAQSEADLGPGAGDQLGVDARYRDVLLGRGTSRPAKERTKPSGPYTEKAYFPSVFLASQVCRRGAGAETV